MSIYDNVKLIIPMSGVGKRFIDAEYNIPKPIINVDGQPIIAHILNLFPGVTDVTFICNENHLVETNMRDILVSLSPKCKIFSTELGQQLNEIFVTSDDTPFIRREEAENYCRDILEEGNNPTKYNIITWHPTED